MRSLALLFLVACAVPPPARPAAARPDAPVGQLAPPPEALSGSAAPAPAAPAPVMPPMHHHGS